MSAKQETAESIEIERIMEENDEDPINYTTPEMDRYDRVYLDSLPAYFL